MPISLLWILAFYFAGTRLADEIIEMEPIWNVIARLA
jgi:hypothetical protein